MTEHFAKKPAILPPADFSLDLGIYFEEGQVTLGTTINGSKQFEKIRSFPSVITFSEDKIYVGKILHGKTHFQLDTLLREASSQKRSFMLVTTSFNLSVEEILACYFQKVLSKVKSMRGAKSIGNIVLTIPFNLTCLEREKLKRAFEIAECHQVRIFSSMVPTALWYLMEENSIFSETIHSKLIFVVHSLKHSFSMAVLQASFNSIIVKSFIVSEDLKDFQDVQFYVGHAQMFSKEGKHQEIVWMAYKSAVEQMLTDISGKRIDKIIGLTKPKYVKKLSQILSKFFSENALTMIESNEPLAGACIYASRDSLSSSVMSPDLQIRESFRSNLILSYESDRFAPRVKNRSFIPGMVASIQIPAPPQEIVLTLQEEFAKGKKLYPVSQYRLLVRGDNPENLTAPITLVNCSIETDQDGILSVVPTFPENVTDRRFVRVDELSKASSAEFERLKNYYKARAPAQSQDKELVRGLTNDAVLFYSVSMKTFDPKGKSPQEILEEHERLKKEAQEKFIRDCEKNGVESKSKQFLVNPNKDNRFLVLHNKTFRTLQVRLGDTCTLERQCPPSVLPWRTHRLSKMKMTVKILKQSNIFPDSTLRKTNLQSIDENQPMQIKDEDFNNGATTVPGLEKLSSINIGIFLDRTDIAVGTTTSTKIRDLQVLLAIPATISFIQNKIQIGLPKSEQLQFSVHQLMQKHITSKDNVSATNGMSLCPEEILAIFFKKLLLRVSKMTKLPIDNIAFTVTFPTTSLGKERLRQGLAMAGYYNIRILSSALSAALWFGLYDNHYVSKNREQKFLLVVHTLQDSFSISIIRVGKTSISTKRCLLSESLSICNENSFKIGHARMFSDDDKNDDQQFAKTVFEAYRTALNRLMTEFGSKQIDRVIGIARSKNDQNLKKILNCFYGDKILTILNSNGPFVGACLLSSRDVLPHTVFPPNVQVTDASRSDLLLLLDSKQLTIIPFKGQQFILGRAATFTIPVTSQGGKLELCEEFPTASVVVAEYSLPEINQEGEKFPRKVNCELSVVQDGVFKITARFGEEEDGNILTNILPVKNKFDTQSLAQITKEFNFEDSLLPDN
ncbi:unnamed protein product [Allacma fusca]|uniref:Hypoxia up-regulated protein 1 n=1 Tax=Allacma fusca TaxID=39272 RepID=A0A8J2KWU8_9HEXA|nr:unnamed protein product [Allacma fusca]